MAFAPDLLGVAQSLHLEDSDSPGLQALASLAIVLELFLSGWFNTSAPRSQAPSPWIEGSLTALGWDSRRPWDFSGCSISRCSAAPLHIWQTPAHLFLSPFTWVTKLLVLNLMAHPSHSHFWSRDEDECAALRMLITHWLRRPACLFLRFLQFPRSP